MGECLLAEGASHTLSDCLPGKCGDCAGVIEHSHISPAEQAAEESQEDGAIEDISPPNLGPSVEELFEEGITRLHHRETWKLWRWPQSDNVFYSPDEFKCAPGLISSLLNSFLLLQITVAAWASGRLLAPAECA